MAYLAWILAAAWFVGMLVLVGVHLNDIRRVLNNLAAGARYTGGLGWDRSKHFRITRIDPVLLNEIGRTHLATAIRNERIMIGWGAVGFILLVWASSYET